MSKQAKKITQIVVMLLILVAIAFIIYVTVTKDHAKVAKVGDDAPYFELKMMDNSPINLNDYKGKGLIINFWGTWCEPCKREMPALSDNYAKYKDKGVEVLTIHLRNNPQQVKQFFSGLDKNVHIPVAFDNNNEVSKAYAIDPLPTTVIIDKEGKIKAVHKGEMTDKMISNYMESVKP